MSALANRFQVWEIESIIRENKLTEKMKEYLKHATEVAEHRDNQTYKNIYNALLRF